jgi:N-acetylmuramic acid 6-phosphate etherase
MTHARVRGKGSADPKATGRFVLGIEAGGSHTVAVSYDLVGGTHRREEGGPANLRLTSDAELLRLWRQMTRSWPAPAAVAIGMAGACTDDDRRRIRLLAAQIWTTARCVATNDLETAWAAAGPLPRQMRDRVVIVSGTGSCCFGKNAKGKSVKVGGWGHFLGDRGSGYYIGLQALRQVIAHLDRTGAWPALGSRLLRALQLNVPEDLVGWMMSAKKDAVAALCSEVLGAAGQGDPIAREIAEGAAESLSVDAIHCARRLGRRARPVDFVLTGGVLTRSPGLKRRLIASLEALWPGAAVRVLDREPVWGAIALARGLVETVDFMHSSKAASPSRELPAAADQATIHQSPTEQRNPRSTNLDRLPVQAAVELMLREEAQVPVVLRKHSTELARAVSWIARALQAGGRLFYVGAGTSGRLGVLDASECPPTFGTSPDTVQGIMAGGFEALWRSVEGAEDNAADGGRAVAARRVSARDVVVGIAASGRTPFVHGALAEARRRGARTVLLCFNPSIRFPRDQRSDLDITVDVGPEVLTGSTRLKCGTATKLVLNVLTTLSMVRWGKVVSNLMIDVRASNTKLRDRAVRIVQELTHADPAESLAVLRKCQWNVKRAVDRLGRASRW